MMDGKRNTKRGNLKYGKIKYSVKDMRLDVALK